MEVASHHSLAELQHLARHERRAQQRLRLQVIILALKGHTARQVSQAVGLSLRTVQECVRRYNGAGVPGLVERRRGGMHRYLSAVQEEELRTHLNRAAADPRAGIRRAAELRGWLQEHFQVLYSLSGLYELLHRLGYSWLMPRPRHGRADPAAQAAFKKTRRTSSRRWRPSIRANGSRSGSTTKPVLDNRAR
jgi:transposase